MDDDLKIVSGDAGLKRLDSKMICGVGGIFLVVIFVLQSGCSPAVALAGCTLATILFVGFLLYLVDRSRAAIQNEFEQVSCSVDRLKGRIHALNQMLNSMPEAVILCDDAFSIYRCNQSFCLMGHWDKDEVLGSKAYDVLPQGILSATDRISSVHDNGASPVVQRRVFEQNRWFEIQCVPVDSVEQDQSLYIEIIRDITGPQIARLALQESEERYRLLMYYIQIPVIVASIETGLVLFVNHRFCSYFGYQAEEIEGHPAKHFWKAAEDRTGFIAKLMRNGTVADFMGEMVRRNGDVCWTLMSASVIDFKGEDASCTVLADITELKRAEEKKQELMEHLEESNIELAHATDLARQLADEARAANTAKGQFLANLSHEIRTPMNGLMGMAAMLLNTDLTPTQAAYAQVVHRSGAALLVLLNNILELTMIESGELSMRIKQMDLRQMLDAIHDVIAVQSEEKQLTFTMEIGDGVPSKLLGDEPRLFQVLVNILGNAVKFTEHGSVKLKVLCSEKTAMSVTILFVVSDTGVGLSKEQQKGIFNAFSQVDGSKTRKYGGLGLGLTIAKRLVGVMEGTIGVKSSLGEGSVFTVELTFVRDTQEDNDMTPMAKSVSSAEVVPASIALSKSADSDEKTCRDVLLVEDYIVNRRVVQAMLKNWPITMDIAENGIEALEMLSKKRYDIVLMDWQMPEMDGLEATRAIRKGANAVIDPSVPIIAMTAHALPQDKQKCLNAGMSDFLAKPIEKPQLSAVLERWLGLSEPAAVKKKKIKTDNEGSHVNQEKDVSPLTDVQEKKKIIPAFDLEGTRARLLDDDELVASIVMSFIEDFPFQLRALEQYVSEGDPEKCGAQGHKIKGSSANVGALTIREAAMSIEKAGKAGDLAGVVDMVHELKRCYAAYCNHVYSVFGRAE